MNDISINKNRVSKYNAILYSLLYSYLTEYFEFYRFDLIFIIDDKTFRDWKQFYYEILSKICMRCKYILDKLVWNIICHDRIV
jgi:hypothetical protein